MKRGIRVPIEAGPKLVLYLDRLVDDGYGDTRAEVARSLAWRALEELINAGFVDRIDGVERDA